jgi:hypothetical protein
VLLNFKKVKIMCEDMDEKTKDSFVQAVCLCKKKLTKVPAILCDIDGVVVRGTGSNPDLVDGAGEALVRILSSRKEDKSVPFMFLTNGGMETEQ